MSRRRALPGPMGARANRASGEATGRSSSGSISSWTSFPAPPTGSRMTGVVQSTATCPNPAGRERVYHVSAQLLLPAGALASLLLGVGLLLDAVGPSNAYTAFALIAIGLGALAIYAFLHGWRSTPARSGEPMPVAGIATTPLPTRPRNGADSRPADRPHVPITGRGSEWRVLSAPASPGDETWLSWLPREHRRLGPEGLGFASGVVHSPGKAGNLVAFPVPNYFHGVRSVWGSGGIVDPAPLTRPSATIAEAGDPNVSPANPGDPGGREPSPSSARAGWFSEEELDRMFPPVSGQPHVILSDAPERVGGVPSWKRETAPAADVLARPERQAPLEESRSSARETYGSWRSRRVPFEGQRADRPGIPEPTTSSCSGSHDTSPRPNDAAADLFLEAANPVPPHLRDAGPATTRGEAHRPVRRSVDPGTQRSVCASCSKVVVNLHMSGPCSKCRRPICNDCLREALVRVGHGWCLDCASASTVRDA
jgi:hypothetical protein